MFSIIRKRFTYANVVLTLALVFAMSGGAYAAKRYLITSTSQISPKVLKSLKGAAGKAGAPGPAGPAGTAGLKGETGAAGAAGPKGETGAEGGRGTQGEPGSPGKEGSPWTAGGTLPSKKTETGAWSFTDGSAGAALAAISFSIPLAAALDEHHVHYIGRLSTGNAECPGTAEEPEAKPGNLCVYEGGVFGVKQAQPNEAEAEIFPAGRDGPKGITSQPPGAGTSGAAVLFIAEEASIGAGTWAVTAP